MRILSLDPGRKCGWALREDDGSMTSGVWDLRVPKGHLWFGVYAYLRNQILAPRPDFIAYEISINKYPNSMLVYLSIVETIKDTGIAFKGYHWNTIKKYATGKGNASKEAMIDAAQEKWLDLRVLSGVQVSGGCKIKAWVNAKGPGFPITDERFDDNEADARWIAEYAASQIGDAT